VSGRLDQRVLVLNRLWQPVNIVGLRRALNLVFRGRASILHLDEGDHRVFPAEAWLEYSRRCPPSEDIAIRTPRIHLVPPRVVLLGEYDRVPRRDIRFNRRNVYLRDSHSCQYCGRRYPEEELNLDHVVPRDRGGVTTWENIVTACIRCNARKGNRLPAQASMELRRAPQRPKWRMLMAASLTADEHLLWKDFLEVTPAGELPWRG
jgi:5-methylcytosine-specific restriction endonuclease McrA